jgi:hypothetical protein
MCFCRKVVFLSTYSINNSLTFGIDLKVGGVLKCLNPQTSNRFCYASIGCYVFSTFNFWVHLLHFVLTHFSTYIEHSITDFCFNIFYHHSWSFGPFNSIVILWYCESRFTTQMLVHCTSIQIWNITCDLGPYKRFATWQLRYC